MAASGPVVLLGCGRLGSAILEGWLLTETVRPSDLIILTPSEKPAAEAISWPTVLRINCRRAAWNEMATAPTCCDTGTPSRRHAP